MSPLGHVAHGIAGAPVRLVHGMAVPVTTADGTAVSLVRTGTGDHSSAVGRAVERGCPVIVLDDGEGLSNVGDLGELITAPVVHVTAEHRSGLPADRLVPGVFDVVLDTGGSSDRRRVADHVVGSVDEAVSICCRLAALGHRGRADARPGRVWDDAIVPAALDRCYDTTVVVDMIVDAGSYAPLDDHLDPSCRLGVGRVAGRPVAVFATTCTADRRPLERTSLRRLQRLRAHTNRLAIPVVSLVDADDIESGAHADTHERLRDLLITMRQATNPMIVILTGRALGAAAMALGAASVESDVVVGWPRALVSGAADAQAWSAGRAAAEGLIADVIDPGETRDFVSDILATLVPDQPS